ncbi:uncharacterized protein B0I36DRAFT_249481 [Microdochium trichocladiopsis]|uniref:Uncharacterized protein n=1 Tax=Microdochium trichocladiopsis TaxID=1682393 RepID=A0A9P8Y2F6_9PEZI|nr:uncharacterized protein B0I36DRAFT_249481 [Microdochium trichocladiopsis]KAH7026324.1 hypothetical protein B0I36DRAFT_249481 [Microdochium trichocladiopsis]
MADVPVVQILDKNKNWSQAIVSLPGELPLPPLADSSLRVRTEIFSLTSNNFTYAKLGSLLGWWNFHPLPKSTPEPYNNPALYGRTNCWGYGRVLESTFPSVPKDSYVFGYLPIGTLPIDLQVTSGRIKGWVVENSPHRVDLMRVYNDYRVYPATPSSSSPSASPMSASSIARRIGEKDDDLALDALLGIVHGIGYLMNNYIFPQDPAKLCHPSRGPAEANPPWAFPEQADLTDATALSFAPGAKTAVLFAHLLKYQRREGTRPRQVIGVTSESSRPFVVTTGLYDDVALTGENPVDVVTKRLGVDPASSSNKVVVVDFGGRRNVAADWVAALRPVLPNLVFFVVGGAIPEPTTAGAGGDDGKDFNVTASFMETAQRNAMLGAEKYLAESRQSWEQVRERGIRGFSVKWGQGMDSAREGWDALARGDVLPEVGLAFKL